MANLPVLIVGAGPSGMVLALSLAQKNVPFRIIDNNAGPGEHSRATVVHARTLEFYRQFGFAEEVVGEGLHSEAIHLRRRDAGKPTREILQIRFGDAGRGLSPYPFILTYPQDVHERLLVRQLEKRGVTIERNRLLEDFTQDATGVDARIVRTDGSTEEARFAYICGCDGAHSQVRKSLAIGFAGGTYEQPFYVADVTLASTPDHDIYMNLGRKLLALMMPVRVTGTERLIGLVPPELASHTELSFEDLRPEIEDLIGIKIGTVNWFSRYRVHHRVAEHFRSGRAFLLGDAGHVHSPVGGQGMNTGIGDAINLGWKLGEVMLGRAPASLLDSYEIERIAFARSLVATTDRVFGPIISTGLRGALIRDFVAPAIGHLVNSTSIVRRIAFGILSQTRINYPTSPLSRGKAGKVRGGDRLPWVDYGASDNFAPLRSWDWQIHVYGTASAELRALAAQRRVPLEVLAWTDAVRRAGLERDAIYVIRPDGYVGYAGPAVPLAALTEYLDAVRGPVAAVAEMAAGG